MAGRVKSTRSTLAKIESNCRQVTDIELKKIAAVLNVSVADLF
ncbi:helix-turn-helix domain-containing protein [Colwellia sp. MT41]